MDYFHGRHPVSELNVQNLAKTVMIFNLLFKAFSNSSDE